MISGEYYMHTQDENKLEKITGLMQFLFIFGKIFKLMG
jgi:hypothetical protein